MAGWVGVGSGGQVIVEVMVTVVVMVVVGITEDEGVAVGSISLEDTVLIEELLYCTFCGVITKGVTI